MGYRDFELPDGTFVEVPSDMPFDQADALAKQKYPDAYKGQVQPASKGGYNNIGSLISGVGNVVQVPGQLAGLAGLAAPDNALVKAGQGIKDYGQSLKSDERKEQELKIALAIQEAEKLGLSAEVTETLKQYASNPGVTLGMLVEQIPMLAATMGSGLGAQLGAKALVKGIGETGLKRAGVAGAAGAGATMQGADVGAETYDRVYKAAVAKGFTPEAAHERALEEARKAALKAGAVSGATMAFLPGAEKALMGINPAKTALRGAARTGLGESVQEAAEEGSGAYFANVGEQAVDPTVDTTRGVGSRATTGAILGGLMGGATGAYGGQQEARKLKTEARAVEDAESEAAASQEEEKKKQVEAAKDTPQALLKLDTDYAQTQAKLKEMRARVLAMGSPEKNSAEALEKAQLREAIRAYEKEIEPVVKEYTARKPEIERAKKDPLRYFLGEPAEDGVTAPPATGGNIDPDIARFVGEEAPAQDPTAVYVQQQATLAREATFGDKNAPIPQDDINEYVGYILADPARAAEAVKAKAVIPGIPKKQSDAIMGLVKMQLDKVEADKKAQEEKAVQDQADEITDARPDMPGFAPGTRPTKAQKAALPTDAWVKGLEEDAADAAKRKDVMALEGKLAGRTVASLPEGEYPPGEVLEDKASMQQTQAYWRLREKYQAALAERAAAPQGSQEAIDANRRIRALRRAMDSLDVSQGASTVTPQKDFSGIDELLNRALEQPAGGVPTSQADLEAGVERLADTRKGLLNKYVAAVGEKVKLEDALSRIPDSEIKTLRQFGDVNTPNVYYEKKERKQAAEKAATDAKAELVAATVEEIKRQREASGLMPLPMSDQILANMIASKLDEKYIKHTPVKGAATPTRIEGGKVVFDENAPASKGLHTDEKLRQVEAQYRRAKKALEAFDNKYNPETGDWSTEITDAQIPELQKTYRTLTENVKAAEEKLRELWRTQYTREDQQRRSVIDRQLNFVNSRIREIAGEDIARAERRSTGAASSFRNLTETHASELKRLLNARKNLLNQQGIGYGGYQIGRNLQEIVDYWTISKGQAATRANAVKEAAKKGAGQVQRGEQAPILRERQYPGREVETGSTEFGKAYRMEGGEEKFQPTRDDEALVKRMREDEIKQLNDAVVEGRVTGENVDRVDRGIQQLVDRLDAPVTEADVARAKETYGTNRDAQTADIFKEGLPQDVDRAGAAYDEAREAADTAKSQFGRALAGVRGKSPMQDVVDRLAQKFGKKPGGVAKTYAEAKAELERIRAKLPALKEAQDAARRDVYDAVDAKIKNDQAEAQAKLRDTQRTVAAAMERIKGKKDKAATPQEKSQFDEDYRLVATLQRELRDELRPQLEAIGSAYKAGDVYDKLKGWPPGGLLAATRKKIKDAVKDIEDRLQEIDDRQLTPAEINQPEQVRAAWLADQNEKIKEEMDRLTELIKEEESWVKQFQDKKEPINRKIAAVQDKISAVRQRLSEVAPVAQKKPEGLIGRVLAARETHKEWQDTLNKAMERIDELERNGVPAGEARTDSSVTKLLKEAAPLQEKHETQQKEIEALAKANVKVGKFVEEAEKRYQASAKQAAQIQQRLEAVYRKQATDELRAKNLEFDKALLQERLDAAQDRKRKANKPLDISVAEQDIADIEAEIVALEGKRTPEGRLYKKPEYAPASNETPVKRSGTYGTAYNQATATQTSPAREARAEKRLQKLAEGKALEDKPAISFEGKRNMTVVVPEEASTEARIKVAQWLRSKGFDEQADQIEDEATEIVIEDWIQSKNWQKGKTKRTAEFTAQEKVEPTEQQLAQAIKGATAQFKAAVKQGEKETAVRPQRSKASSTFRTGAKRGRPTKEAEENTRIGLGGDSDIGLYGKEDADFKRNLFSGRAPGVAPTIKQLNEARKHPLNGMTFLQAGEWLVKQFDNPLQKSLANKVLQVLGNVPGTIEVSMTHAAEHNGMYAPSEELIYLSPAVFNDSQALRELVLHELTHAATLAGIETNPQVARDIYKLLQHVKAWTKTKEGQQYLSDHPEALDSGEVYAVTDVHEFVADTFSNPAFQEMLKQIPPQRGMLASIKNAWSAFINRIAELFGAKHPRELQTLTDAVAVAEQALLANWLEYETKDFQTEATFGSPKRLQDFSDAFKRWFGNSKIVNKNGTPKVMYHGTARDVSEFKPKQARAIFVTDDPAFAGAFGEKSMFWMVSNAGEVLGEKKLRNIVEEYRNEISNELEQIYANNVNLPAYLQRPIETKVRQEKIARLDAVLAKDKIKLNDGFIHTGLGFSKLGNRIVEALPSAENTMPLYVRAENAFDFEDQAQIEKLLERFFGKEEKRFVPDEENGTTYNRNKMRQKLLAGDWGVIEDINVQKAIKELGHDGFWVKEENRKNLGVYESNQLKSVTGNTGAYSRESGIVVFSPKRTYTSPDIEEASNTFIGRDKGKLAAIREAATGLSIRTRFVDNYAALKEALKRGDATYAIQVMYDLMNYAQRNHMVQQSVMEGPPVRVKSKHKGKDVRMVEAQEGGPTLRRVSELLAAVKGFGDHQATSDAFTMYALAKRAQTRGWDRVFADTAIPPNASQATADKIRAENAKKSKARAQADALVADENSPFLAAYKEYQDWNKGMLQFAQQAGVIKEEDFRRLASEANYTPLFRKDKHGNLVLEIDQGRDITVGRLADEPHLQKLLGGSGQVMDFFTASVRNASVLVDAALHNIASREAVMALQALGAAHPISATEKNENVIEFRGVDPETGKWDLQRFAVDTSDTAAADIPTDLLVKGFAGVPASLPGWVRMMGVPAQLLRKTVTRNPLYMFRQLVRDPLSAWLATGADMNPLTDTLAEVGKSLTGKSDKTLDRRGITGGMLFSENEMDIERIQNEAKKAPAWSWGYWMAKFDHAAMGADAITRRNVYQGALREGASEIQATLAAYEAMPFSKRGSSPSVRSLNHMVPFLSAAIQGWDVLYRSAFTKDMPLADRVNIRNKLLARGAMIGGITMMYTMAMGDDDVYKNANTAERLSNWFVKIPGTDITIKLPTPFEYGILFKMIPEAMVRSATQDKDFGDEMRMVGGALWQMVPNVVLPQGVIPLVEAQQNTSFFTGRPIEGRALQDIDIGLRADRNTSELSKLVGFDFEAFGTQWGISPKMLEHVLGQYTAGLYPAFAALIDTMLPAPTVDKPDRTLAELPLFKSALQQEDAGGQVNRLYDKIDKFTRYSETFKKLVETNPVKAQEYVEENAENVAKGGMAAKMKAAIDKISNAENVVRNSTMTAAQKKEALDNFKRVKTNISSQFASAL